MKCGRVMGEGGGGGGEREREREREREKWWREREDTKAAAF